MLVAGWVPAASLKANALLEPGCTEATARHQNASHTGASCTTLPSNPAQQWSVTLSGKITYPLIAAGKVFATTTAANGESGGWLYALDAVTGENAWGPVPLGGTYSFSSLAYDAGTVFVNNFDGTITAFDAATGAQRWAQRTSNFAGDVVARNGVVYEQGSGPVHAIAEATGDVLWGPNYFDGDGSSVAVDDDGVYVVAGCSRYRLSLTTGQVVWSGNDGCSGGGGGVTYPTATHVFASSFWGSSYVLDKATGKIVGTYGGMPAFSGGTAYFATDHAIAAEDELTLTPKFTTVLPAAVSTSPVVAGGVVYVGAGANVYAVDGTTGQITWTGSVPAPTGPGWLFGEPSGDIAVGNGLLVVPAGNTLTAFGAFLPTPPVPPTTTTTTTSTTTTTTIPAGPTATQTTVAASANPVAFGQPVSFVATVEPSDGQGSVRFTASGTVMPECGAVPVQHIGSSFVALCTASALLPGNDVIHAEYSGDDAFTASTGTFTETVSPAATTTVAKAYQLAPVGATRRVALLAVVTSNVTGASVAGKPLTFVVGARTCAATTNAQGLATCIVSYAPGARIASRTWAMFEGTSNYLASRVVTPIV